MKLCDGPTAIDINGDWVALNGSGRESIFEQMLPLYNALIAHEQQRARRFLRAIPRLDRLIEARLVSRKDRGISGGTPRRPDLD
jgi:hypothetical protein